MLSWRYNRFQPEIDRVESVGNVAKEVSEKKSGKYQEYAGEVLNLVACHITFVVTIRHRILLEIFGPQIQLPYPLKSFELKQRRARYWLLLTCLSPIASVL